MNINDYRKAMDHISPSNELKERIMHKKTTHRRYAPVHRVLASTLIAVLMLNCVTTVALAASPELRRAVLSFFRIEEREQVPGQPDINPSDINQPDVNQPYDNQPETLLEAGFWEIKDNNLVPVQVDMRTSQIDITFQDINYQGNLYWFIRNGELHLFQGSPYGVDTRPEDEWSVEAIPERTDVLLLKLAQGQQTDYTEYPMLFYLDTGETEDFLASTGARELEYAYDYSWSENMRRALILCSAGMGGLQEWLCDLDARTLIRLDELTGMGEEVSAGFADNDTLILTTHTTSEEDETWQTITCDAYDIPTGQKTKTLDKAHYYRWWDEPYGAQLFGSRCVLIGEDGQVRLVDLKTGMQTVVEGFTWQTGDEFMPSPSGNKLLYYSSDSKAEGLGISQLGVVDLEKGTFIAFDREGYGNLYEEGIGWSNDNTVSINARSSDGETRYLILYTF